jgi:hypothetical protein
MGTDRQRKSATVRCSHPERLEGVCRGCGHCAHEVVLNGRCYTCGAADLELTVKPRGDPGLVPASRLRR